MKKLVINTIQLAQLNVIGSKFFFEDVNLFYEVNNVIEKNKIILDDNHMKINNNINKTIMVKVDKLRFEELFDNLVSNAIKYSPNGGIITIDAKEDKDFITISIKDSGIGMTTDQIDHIFDEFYKADKSQHDFNSSGLGLSICKRIVETLGGKIWAESLGVGKGSTFYFTVLKGCRINEDNVLMKKDKKLSYIEAKNVRKSYLGKYYSNYSYNSDSNKD
jgi:signal transduction histidine kinase